MTQMSGMLGIDASRESLSFSTRDEIEAEIKINSGTTKAQVSRLDDSRNILEAEVSYQDKLIYDTNVNDGKATLILDTDDDGGWLYWINPASWLIDDVDDQWQIALSRAVPIHLDVDLNAGAVTPHLDDLDLTDLTVDGGTGFANILLPSGDNDMMYDVDGGQVEMTLPPNGYHIFSIDSWVGILTINIPLSLQARLVFESGSGRLRINTDRLVRVELTEGDIWESHGFAKAVDKVDLLIDLGSGDVIIQER
jgi:hypothetical protein